MSEIEEIKQNKNTYHASQKRAIIKWQKNNKEKVNEYAKNLHRTRMLNDEQYRLTRSLQVKANYQKKRENLNIEPKLIQGDAKEVHKVKMETDEEYKRIFKEKAHIYYLKRRAEKMELKKKANSI